MAMVETHKIPYHICGCGYKTSDRGNASKHKKVSCGHTMILEVKEFVFKEDYDRDVKTSLNTIHGNVGVVNQNVDNSVHQNITINLTVPDKTIVGAIYDVINNQECINEIRHADPHQIPAILFKYTRGTKAEQQVIKYDPDKNVVKHKDSVTGQDVSQDLKKFRNEYLAEQADVYDDVYHIPYFPLPVQKNMTELAKPMFDNGKKKDDPIPAAEVIKICATGDHRMYKLPHDTKRFYTQVANDIDKEIKSSK
ncbi:protein of unknown function (DUF1390) [Paramecium bursaria Chlorella virus AP110A]|nr:protein of unknown function (DUF1390) [Paramecium bursaria Chlorella virus AP110A]